MRRSTLYIVLSMITLLAMFATAATCSFCGAQIYTTEDGQKGEE